MSNAPQPITTTDTAAATAKAAVETAAARDFISALKYRYHYYEHAAAAVETELREILAGRRKQLTRLRNLQRRANDADIALNTYLARITDAVKHPGKNPRLVQLLQEKFGRLNEKVHVPRETEEDEE